MKISYQKLGNEIVNGVSVAQRKFRRITGGAWLSDGAFEAYQCCFLGEHLKKQFPFSYVSPEALRDDFELGLSARRQGGKSKIEIGSKRVDLLIWTGREAPIAAIEIKRIWKPEEAWTDCDRIARFFQAYGRNRTGIKYGFFSCFKSYKKEKLNLFDSFIGKQLPDFKTEIDKLFNKRITKFEISSNIWTGRPQNFAPKVWKDEYLQMPICIGFRSRLKSDP